MKKNLTVYPQFSKLLTYLCSRFSIKGSTEEYKYGKKLSYR